MDLIETIRQHGFHVNPSVKEIEYYRNKGTRFQMIQIVANIHSFGRRDDGVLSAYPYSLSLMPASKRGLPENVSIEWIANMDIE